MNYPRLLVLGFLVLRTWYESIRVGFLSMWSTWDGSSELKNQGPCMICAFKRGKSSWCPVSPDSSSLSILQSSFGHPFRMWTVTPAVNQRRGRSSWPKHWLHSHSMHVSYPHICGSAAVRIALECWGAKRANQRAFVKVSSGLICLIGSHDPV
jgi:hypothetical protein